MALSFTKKAVGGGVSQATKANTSSQTSTAATNTASKTSGGISFFKKGTAAKQAIAHEEAKAEQAKAEMGKLWRFFVKEGEDRQITFLDGDLDDEGMLDIDMFYQHKLFTNGEYSFYVCTAEIDESTPCPICEAGDKPTLVGLLTVIDHTPYTVKQGQNAGKVIKDSRKLYVATRTTVKLLTKLAVKRGGLTGCTFDVSRTTDKSPSVGDQLDFVEKQKLSDMAAKLDLKPEEVAPAIYADEIRYLTPAELIKLGVGKAQTGPGYNKASAASLKDEL